jgi:GNAT superfamily N-acetyltransferase
MRMNFEIRDEVPPLQEYIDIRLRAGLSRKSAQAAELGLRNGIFAVTAYVGDKRVGIGRIVGDRGCFFQITDMAVVPEYQKLGIGSAIMKRLLEFLQENAPSTAYISLMADHDTPKFYERFGFTPAISPKSAGMYKRVP